MPGKNPHINCSLSNNLRNALSRIVELKVDGLSFWIINLDFLGGLPPLTGLAPHQVVEFVDGGAHANFERELFFLFRSLFK